MPDSPWPDSSCAGRPREHPDPASARQILVIRLSALGNMVMSFSAFAAIHQHHPKATIALLTTAPYAAWMAESPWFDRVLIDARPAWWDLPGVFRLCRLLRSRPFDRVYDLQTSRRSSRYFQLFARRARPEWSGIAPGCSHPHTDPDRIRLHDIERQYSQLRQAGVTETPTPDLGWCRGDIARFGLKRPFALLVPGSSPHRPIKRWPAAHYRALADWLAGHGILPVVVGTAGERPLAETICAHTNARDLTGQTSFGDLADLGRAAAFAVGNDTGPMHLLAAIGCRSLVLFSHDSDPARCAPRAPADAAPAGAAPAGVHQVQVLRRPDLATLPPQDVTDALASFLPGTQPPHGAPPQDPHTTEPAGVHA